MLLVVGRRSTGASHECESGCGEGKTAFTVEYEMVGLESSIYCRA